MRRGLTWLTSGIFFLCLTTAIASPAQTFTRLHSFAGKDGAKPYAGLVQATDGNLYGTTLDGRDHGSGTVFKITSRGKLTTLHTFTWTDGGAPTRLVQATDGNLYGTTHWGGANRLGTVFKITLSGKLTTLYSFCSQNNCTDGSRPYVGLVQAANGNLYGTTYYGGANGLGTVFKITPRGKLTTLHSFESYGYPEAELVQATDGNLYGTTLGGWDDNGTVFKITPRGKLTTLHTFTGTDGSAPRGALVQATNGNLYGTTVRGGASGEGTVFKITSRGKLTTLHTFTGTDSSNGLIQAADGNLYGTTYGGWYHDYGTIFKITLSGKLKTLYRFCLQITCTDGSGPAGLVQATNGNLYGTTFGGGHNGLGTVFSLSVSAPEQAGSK